MKLRNKKTGDIAVGYVMVGIQNNEKYPNPIEYHTYGSLAELNDEWEDYEPVEPLIKDKHHPERAEKARKTLKMWADANGFKKVSYHVDSYVSVFYNEFNPVECAIKIEFGWIMEGLKPGTYGITELCGEEE